MENRTAALRRTVSTSRTVGWTGASTPKGPIEADLHPREAAEIGPARAPDQEEARDEAGGRGGGAEDQEGELDAARVARDRPRRPRAPGRVDFVVVEVCDLGQHRVERTRLLADRDHLDDHRREDPRGLER